ncbi:MAG: aa3-type cytochrome c oxidase subunit IV [Pseudomonadota bacterium]
MAEGQKSDAPHEEHVVGTMNIDVQEKTFAAFVAYVGRGMAVCVVALILLYLING